MAHPSRSGRIALVSGLDISGYGIVRSLGRAGITVFSLCTPRTQFGRFSRYSAGWFPYMASPEDYPDQVCQLLLDVRNQFDAPPVLFATSDWFTQVLCQYQEKLASHYLYHWVPRELLETVVNKAQLNDWCLQAGVTIPETYVTRPGDDLAAAAKEFSYPCLVKPTLRTNPVFRQNKNFLADSPAALLDLYARFPELAGTTLWQQYVPGDDENIFQCTALVRRDGGISDLVTVRKLAQYPPNGMMCFGRTEKHPALEQAACRLLERLNYRGLASIEFKYSPEDGRFYFVEINARLPWYSSLFTAAGVNLPVLAVSDLAGEPALAPAQPTERVHWMGLENAAKSVLRNAPRPSRPWLQFLADVGMTKSFAWWDWRDPLPFFAYASHLVWRLAEKLNPFADPATPAAPAPKAVPMAPGSSADAGARPTERQPDDNRTQESASRSTSGRS